MSFTWRDLTQGSTHEATLQWKMKPAEAYSLLQMPMQR